jgi:hypothetical protein
MHTKTAAQLLSTVVLCTSLALPSGATPPAEVGSTFEYRFDCPGTLEEAPYMSASTSPYWWLNSGARFHLDGQGETVHGALPSADHWRLSYAASNPVDTDNGYHPQNLFRLFTRSTWGSARQNIAFRIDKYRTSASPNRNASNGVLLMSRYQNDDNVYYAGVRVDGAAVIKKKKAGRYYTLGYAKVLPGTYDRNTNPNLLPTGVWMRLSLETRNRSDGSVRVRLHMDAGDGEWQLLLDVVDDGAQGGAPIRQAGHAGLRSDFMDAEYESYSSVAL